MRVEPLPFEMEEFMRQMTCFALLLVLVSVGCSPDAKPTTPADGIEDPTAGDPPTTPDRGTIGFSALTLKNPFFKIIGDSITAEAENNGFKVIVNDADRDVNTQSKHIDNFIAQGVSAIVINPADRIAIGPAIKKANEAGIPVFTCDLQCVAEDVEIAGHIGTDNYQGGRLAGEAMIKALGDEGGEILVLHFKQANSCVERVRGFTEVLNEHNESANTGKVEIVSELEGGGLQDQGLRATSDALQAHANLRGIFAINDPSAIGAYTALQQAKKVDQVIIVGFDGQIEGLQAIKDGKIFADPIQFPTKMGAVSVQNIIKYLDGEEYDEVQLIPTELYTKEDADKDDRLK